MPSPEWRRVIGNRPAVRGRAHLTFFRDQRFVGIGARTFLSALVLPGPQISPASPTRFVGSQRPTAPHFVANFLTFQVAASPALRYYLLKWVKNERANNQFSPYRRSLKKANSYQLNGETTGTLMDKYTVAKLELKWQEGALFGWRGRYLDFVVDGCRFRERIP
jgi:hypothetical protein